VEIIVGVIHELMLNSEFNNWINDIFVNPGKKDYFYYLINSIGIFVTLIFSLLIWRATRQATKATVQATELSKEIFKYQQKQEEIMKSQYRQLVSKQVSEILETLNKLIINIDTTTMSKLPESFKVEADVAGRYFDAEEQKMLIDLQSSYRSFKQMYFRNGAPSYTIDQNLRDNLKYESDEFSELLVKLEGKIFLQT
jgi:hypothetical protein